MSNWISVKERLPEDGQHCLIYCPQSFPKNIRMLSATFYNDVKEFYCDAFEGTHTDCTHWQPIPEPPKQEQ